MYEYEELAPLNEDGSRCPFQACEERALSMWEESQEELASRLKLGEKWEAARRKQPFPVWQSRILVKELAYLFR